MEMRNEIVISAEPLHVFEIAGATERWPQILPHYRYVRVLQADGNRRIVEMAARRSLGPLGLSIPVRWRAEQLNDANRPQIFFRHLGGWTGGMQVFWRFTPLANGKTRVRIDHVLRSPLASFIGKYFIDPIATRTLQCIKNVVEAARHDDLGAPPQAAGAQVGPERHFK
jgi:ribosome-associated toxin RatA of RatAB toxin-antitoxin module